MTVAEAQERFDALEFAEWCAYWNIEPPMCERMEIAIAIAASRVVNSWGGKTKPKDLIADYTPKRPKTEDEMIAMLDILAGRMGGTNG